MPRKKATTVQLEKPQAIDSFATMADELKLNDSYKSLLLGFAVVMLAAVLVIGYIKNRNTQNLQTAQEVTSVPSEKKADVLASYTIQSGDDLKTISTTHYETPDMFLLLAKENSIENPDTIEEGQNLMIPKVDKKQFMPSLVEGTNKQSIADTAYTVQDGDLLWNIAVRAYGDGYKWKDIVSVNNLQSPDAIFTGMILQLPR